MVRRGDCDPVTVYERDYPRSSPPADGVSHGGSCETYGVFRWGTDGLKAGGIQRLGVRPDGSAVVFEVTDATASFRPRIPLSADQEGIYIARADGSGSPRRIGPASSRVSLQGDGYIDEDLFYSFSPDGRTIVYTDLAPDRTAQVVTLDVTTGTRTQLTHLPPGVHKVSRMLTPTCCARFLDAESSG